MLEGKTAFFLFFFFFLRFEFLYNSFSFVRDSDCLSFMRFTSAHSEVSQWFATHYWDRDSCLYPPGNVTLSVNIEDAVSLLPEICYDYLY
jgi:hypothetical protein